MPTTIKVDDVNCGKVRPRATNSLIYPDHRGVNSDGVLMRLIRFKANEKPAYLNGCLSSFPAYRVLTLNKRGKQFIGIGDRIAELRDVR